MRTNPSSPSSPPEVEPSQEGAAGSPGQAAIERLGEKGLIGFLAMSMALAALGIDLLLPAFGDIKAAFGLAPDSNATASLITTYFLGLAAGQLLYGFASDRYGRKKVLYAGYAIYFLGAVASLLAPSFGWLLAARGLWGFGAAGPRVVTLAVVRDTWSGEKMSRAMSFVMAVFILVPIVSPVLGSAVLVVAPWQWVFAICAVAVCGIALWGRRLPETLDPANRTELRASHMWRAAKVVVGNRVTLGYMLALTSLYVAFSSWIGSAELIIADVFDQADNFPWIFAGLGCVLGAAMLLNARIVERVGTRRLATVVMSVYVVVAGGLVALALANGGTPPLWGFMPVMAALLGSHALTVPNFNSLAMDPMGAVAGTASAVIGSVQVAVGALLGEVINQMFDGTITPISVGFLGFGVLSLVLVLWAERGRPVDQASPADVRPEEAAVPAG